MPGRQTCGPGHDRWNKERVVEKLALEEKNKTTFVLPIATIIETGNHIAQSAGNRFDCAQLLASLMKKTAMEQTPWAAFSEQSALWAPPKLKELAASWPSLAAERLSLGDATIKDIALHYASAGYQVEILTGDAGLKSYEPAMPLNTPRRRQRFVAQRH